MRQVLVLAAMVNALATIPGSAQEGNLDGMTTLVRQGGISAVTNVSGSPENGYTARVTVFEGARKVSSSEHGDIFSPIGLPEVRFAEMDKANDTPEVFIAQWTGGAHCCVAVTVHDKAAGGWTALDGGAFDGDPEALYPQDVDGDGLAEIVTYDNAFLYRFAAYAMSYAPPKVLAIRNGHLEDVTAEPAYAPLLRRRLDDMGELPENGEARNSWLAAYAATLVRLGEAGPLEFAGSAYDPGPDWGMTRCKDPARENDCPAGLVERVDFPTALRQFLTEQGYLEESR
ncbi:hypothetical protein CSC94_02060 [Zhengella mangrovi]|uniref:Uncharacterized protein n=1 Tax=Zhengella mangrovi TaxID=1982044 RepID=A0A2G1QTJ9_9HYPH|nr:hypothetical protein [Zhengella mangrovi]PHP68801.1 hypothetical protein CSC94_02060 [Zhengella mangrovi]